MKAGPVAVAVETVASRIGVVRGQKVILDSDLAALYGVPTKRLNEQVRRNAERFPDDFTFQLDNQELADLRSQFATSSPGGAGAWGGRRHAASVFTEHGALMAATVLNSPRAVEVSVYVVRAFVKLRELMVDHKELARKLKQLESRIERKLTSQDEAIAGILEAIRDLMTEPEPARRPIGFVPLEDRKPKR
ncbi:MAG TPA: ORF6N domain-containing protein [Burkholderiaceae bacterium]